MPEIVGHDKIIARLERGIPLVSIFVGERSVGKWTTALWVRDRLDIREGDFLALKSLTADAAREATQFLKRAPFGKVRLLVANLSGASRTTQGMLLTSLESLRPTSMVILVAPPDTLSPPLLSRGEVFEFSPLSDENVAQILMSRNFGEAKAVTLAALARGQVVNALRFAEVNDTRNTVIGAVRSLLTRDAKTLDTFASRWTDEHTELLATMCREAISGRTALFTQEEIEALGRKLALKVLTAIRPEVRPRLVVHSQLMTVLKGE